LALQDAAEVQDPRQVEAPGRQLDVQRLRLPRRRVRRRTLRRLRWRFN